MIRIYFAQPIDIKPDNVEVTIREFKKIFTKFPNIEVYGAGFNDSPIINPDKVTWTIERVIVAYDLRQIRQCDILLIVTDTHTFCAGTMMELEYARQLGIFTIMLSLSKEVKNIFLLTMIDRLAFSAKELEDILKEISSLW